EEVALEPQCRLALHQREGVGQREQDQVVLPAGSLEEGATVLDVLMHPRVGVDVIGVVQLAELIQLRVDLYRVDALCSPREGDAGVVPTTGTDDEHVVE